MSDDLLLSLLWFVPLAGCLIVLLIPKRAELAIKGFSLGVTLVTFALTLVALAAYVAPDSAAATPLAERAENNALPTPRSPGPGRPRAPRRAMPSTTWSSATPGSPTSTSSTTWAWTGSASA